MSLHCQHVPKKLLRYPANMSQHGRYKRQRPPAVASTSRPPVSKGRDRERRTMASSSAIPGSYYGPINPSILDFIEVEENRGVTEATPGQQTKPRTPPDRPGLGPAAGEPVSSVARGTAGASSTSASTPPARPTAGFSYGAPNPALFGGFDDGDSAGVPVADERATQIGRLQEECAASPQPFTGVRLTRSRSRSRGARTKQSAPRGQQKQQAAAVAASSSRPADGVSNPYYNIIASRQNAMTVEFLRSQEIMTFDDLPEFPVDDFG